MLNPSVHRIYLSTLEIQNNEFVFIMDVTERLYTKAESAKNSKAKTLFKMKIDGGKFDSVFSGIFAGYTDKKQVLTHTQS